MRKIIAIITLIMVLISTNLIYAEVLENERTVGEDYGVRFVSLTSVSTNFELDASKASISSRATGQSSLVDRIVLTAKLKKLEDNKWTTVKTWHKDVSSASVIASGNMTVPRGYTYKVVADIYTYKNGVFLEYKHSESGTQSN